MSPARAIVILVHVDGGAPESLYEEGQHIIVLRCLALDGDDSTR